MLAKHTSDKWVNLLVFFIFFPKRDFFHDFLFVCLDNKPFQNGLGEQFLAQLNKSLGRAIVVTQASVSTSMSMLASKLDDLVKFFE